jgi:hypothetical protein
MTLNNHLTSKLQVSRNFTLDRVADSNYRGKCDVGVFLMHDFTNDSLHVYRGRNIAPRPCGISVGSTLRKLSIRRYRRG